jgi:EmrB/QacA subfamily drug resistance transporter
MNHKQARWLALYVLCLGDLMIVLDTNIVNVALPSIQADLGFSQTALAWVVNAYMLTFGGFLLLSGRLGDLFGNKRVFLVGVVAFTSASIACGLAANPLFLVVGRAVQGLGGAAVSAVALALIMGLFTDPAERAKAMGFFGFVVSGGGAVGVLAGGVLTGLLNWHWIFLVNVPIGVGVWLAAGRVLPADDVHDGGQRLDVPGAGLVTLSLMIAVYGVVGGNEAGWSSFQTLGLLAVAAVLMVAFVVREARVEHPLVPLRLFKLRNVAISQILGVLWAGAMFAWFFLSALYLQQVLGYGALEVGLAYLPACLVMAYCSLRVSDRLVMRIGIRVPLATGLGLVAVSLALFAFAPVGGEYVVHVLPAMVLLGLGAGIAFNPGPAGRDGRRRAARSRSRLWCGQHQLHDGRRPRPGDPGRGLVLVDRRAARPDLARVAARRLPGRVRSRRSLRGRGRRDRWRLPAAEADGGAGRRGGRRDGRSGPLSQTESPLCLVSVRGSTSH